MSLPTGPGVRSNHPITLEFGAITAVLAGVYLWERTLREVTDPLSTLLGTARGFDGLLVGGLVSGCLFLVGLALFAGTYTASRDVAVGLSLPSPSNRRLLGLAVGAPVVLVGVTALVGSATGVSYGSLTMTSYGADAPTLPVLSIVGLGLFVGVPSLVLICQVLVQGSFERAVGGDGAVVLTTLLTGFVMRSHSGLATTPDPGKLAGAGLFVFLLGLGAYASEYGDRERPRRLAYLPVLLFVAVVVGSGIVGLGSLAEGLFALTHLAVLGIAAYTYERSGSLLVPALAYLDHSLATSAVVLLESGVSLA